MISFRYMYSVHIQLPYLQTEALTGQSECQSSAFSPSPVIVEWNNIYHQSLGTELVISEPYESARGPGELLIFPYSRYLGTICIRAPGKYKHSQ